MATNSTESFPSFTVTARGEDITFTSAFATLADAWRALKAHVTEQAAQGRELGFAGDLLVKAQKRQLSPKQAAWLHKLATDAVRPQQRNVEPELDLSAVVEMFDRAFEAGKKFPRVSIGDVVLKRAGDRSKMPGTLNILVGEDTWAGRVNRDGTVSRSRGWTDDVRARLRALAADPVKVTAQHGIATGVCCYCGRELTDKRSRSVGYGPICADKFGLPWGDTTAADEADAAARAEVEAVDQTELCGRLFDESAGNGHDFGILELVLESYPVEQRLAVRTAIEGLDHVDVYDTEWQAESGDYVTQFWIRDTAFEEFRVLAGR